jgi:hypothetical protein
MIAFSHGSAMMLQYSTFQSRKTSLLNDMFLIAEQVTLVFARSPQCVVM